VRRSPDIPIPTSGPYLSVIIPAYNEAQRLEGSLEHVVAYLDKQPFSSEVLVVDDGSTDGTAAIARNYAGEHAIVRILRYPLNHGKGHAVRVGMNEANGQLMLLCDADLSTPIEELEKLAPFVDEGYDVVIGSRALPDSDLRVHQPWLRERLGRAFNLLVRILGVRGFADTQCGFKLFTRRAARDVFPQLFTDRWAFDVEALLVARMMKYKIREVPVIWVNSPGSKVNVLRDAVATLRDLLRIRAAWLLRRPRCRLVIEETAPFVRTKIGG
jgi:dolichyl-phosphate beta-glucosyltransferase